jgi:hypothetical protein
LELNNDVIVLDDELNKQIPRSIIDATPSVTNDVWACEKEKLLTTGQDGSRVRIVELSAQSAALSPYLRAVARQQIRLGLTNFSNFRFTLTGIGHSGRRVFIMNYSARSAIQVRNEASREMPSLSTINRKL